MGLIDTEWVTIMICLKLISKCRYASVRIGVVLDPSRCPLMLVECHISFGYDRNWPFYKNILSFSNDIYCLDIWALYRWAINMPGSKKGGIFFTKVGRDLVRNNRGAIGINALTLELTWTNRVKCCGMGKVLVFIFRRLC